MDEWMERLREQTEDVHPTGDAPARVARVLARRRRRRRRVVAAGAVAAVALVASSAAAVPRLIDADTVDPVDPVTSSTSSAPDPVDAEFRCPLENPVFTDDPPELDLQTIHAQKRTNSEIVNRDFDGFEIQEIETFVYYGVYALVTGDLARAKQDLSEYGVSGVTLWDSGLDPYAQFERMLQADLDAEMRYAKNTTRGIAGRAGFAYWDEAGAILVQWESPVPEEVLALEDADVGGDSRIIVRGVPYSMADVRRAQNALDVWQAQRDMRWDLSVSTACGDFSGLVVRVPSDSLRPGDRRTLQILVAEAIGMPAYVVPVE